MQATSTAGGYYCNLFMLGRGGSNRRKSENCTLRVIKSKNFFTFGLKFLNVEFFIAIADKR